MALTYHLTLGSPVPAVVVELIRQRFGAVTIRRAGGRTMLVGAIVDQASARALLNLLWDVGGDVRLLRITAAGHPPTRRFPSPS